MQLSIYKAYFYLYYICSMFKNLLFSLIICIFLHFDGTIFPFFLMFHDNQNPLTYWLASNVYYARSMRLFLPLVRTSVVQVVLRLRRTMSGKGCRRLLLFASCFCPGDTMSPLLRSPPVSVFIK